MSDENDIEDLAVSAAGMKRSWRRPVFAGLLLASIAGTVILLKQGHGFFDWNVIVAVLVGGIAMYVLLTGYTGNRLK